MQVRYIKNITKEYPDMIRVVVYREKKPFIIKEHSSKDYSKLLKDDYIPDESSLRRTKTLIRDYVLANDFELFVTFTFDPDKVDSFNFKLCQSRIVKWLHNQKSRSPDLAYLIVPEQHKSGRWHFHALISHFKGVLSDSNHKSDSGRRIYNIKSYRLGFSTAVKIDDKDAVSNYVTKYITKDFLMVFNQRRFACSRNLKRPKKTTNSRILFDTEPLFKRQIYSCNDYDLIEIPKW